jgi:hypothetical protein
VTAPGSRDHVEILDAGRAIGGSQRDVDLTVLTARVPDHAEFDSLPLHFAAVELPPGIQRLGVHIAARLATPQQVAPSLQIE